MTVTRNAETTRYGSILPITISRRRSDVNRRCARRRIGSRAGTVKLAVAQHDAFERRIEHGAFERDDAADADRAIAFGLRVERIGFRMRLRPWRISPRDALRDQAPRTRRDRSIDEMTRAFGAKARVAADCFAHLRGIEAAREIGQLVDHDVRFRRGNGARERIGIEYVDDHRLNADRAQRIGLRCITRRACHVMSRVAEQHGKPPSDDAGRAREKYPVMHRRFTPSSRRKPGPILILIASQGVENGFRLSPE